MILFGDRKKLENKYVDWLKVCKTVKDSNFNLISFLVASDLLDEEKVKQLLKEEL